MTDKPTSGDIKLRFLNVLGVEMRFLPELEGAGMFPVGLRSSTLTKEQFSGLIELLYEYGARNGVVWSEPEESCGMSVRRYVDRCYYSETGWAWWEDVGQNGLCTCEPALAIEAATAGETDLNELAERLERMVSEPAWPRFYMDKPQAALCAAALRTLAQTKGE